MIYHTHTCVVIIVNIAAHIRTVIKSLEKVIEFYNTSVEDTNFDGLYGLRVVEGKCTRSSLAFTIQIRYVYL